MKTTRERIEVACHAPMPSIYTVRDMRDDINDLKSELEQCALLLRAILDVTHDVDPEVIKRRLEQAAIAYNEPGFGKKEP